MRWLLGGLLVAALFFHPAVVIGPVVPLAIVGRLYQWAEHNSIWWPTNRMFERFCRDRRARALPPARVR